jgi:protein disulfide-isomerase A4
VLGDLHNLVPDELCVLDVRMLVVDIIIDGNQFVRNKIVEIAKHFKDSNLRFAISSEDEFEDEIKQLGLEDSGSDVNVGCYTEKQKFRMEPTDDFESTDLAMFLEGLRTGKIKPYMKSLPTPKTQEGVIKKIVAHNYDEEIHKVKKDAVIFFHAPWCGHCKEFDPVYKKVAKKMLKNNENIVFGRMDGTSNDIPYMFPPLKGFPSIFFISAYEKYDPILYQGDRTYKSVKDWINRHSSIFLTEDERMGESEDDEDEMPELPDEMESFQDEDMEESITGKVEETEEVEGVKKDEL